MKTELSEFVLDSVVNHSVSVFSGQSLVGQESVRVESSASFDVFPYFGLKSGFLSVRHNHSADFAAPLKDAP
ncbi:MAG TPA: hypothetical protein VGD59_05750 [Acidisarcina sp.]